jgi:hypothetical protein
MPIERKRKFSRFHWDSRLQRVEQVQFTGDGETVVMLNRAGGVEYYDVRFNAWPTTFRIDAPTIRVMAVSRDGKMIAYGHDSDFSVWRIGEIPSPRNVRLMELLDRHFRDGAYDRLDAIAEYLQKEARPSPWNGRWSRYETLIENLADAPWDPRDSAGHDERIKKWMEARPDSATAKLVAARRDIALAWEARGSGFADTVTEEGWEGFRKNIEEARTIVVPIADSEKPPPEVYPLLFLVAKAQSWDRERIDEYVEKMMKSAPRQYSAHSRVGELLMPRWGGRREDAVNYATRIGDRIGGAEGDAVYARVVLTLRPYHRADVFLEEHRFDIDRVHRGIAQLAAEVDDDPMPLHEGLLLARMCDDKRRAKEYVAKLAPFDERWPLNLWRSRETYLAIKEWASGGSLFK